MGGTAGEHEQMPDTVRMPEPGIERVEDDSGRVEESPARSQAKPPGPSACSSGTRATTMTQPITT